MHLTPFVARNMSEALALVKTELGDEAVIVDTENLPDGTIRIMVAIEDDEVFFDEKEQPQSVTHKQKIDDSKIRECLEYHNVMDVVKNKILSQFCNLCREAEDAGEERLLSAAFDRIFRFGSLFDNKCRLKLFMGVPGCGKSTAIAKFAARCRFQKNSVCIISADNVRAGANSQLKAFADILEVPFKFAPDAEKLFRQTEDSREKYDFVLIDTPGINPFMEKEVEKLNRLTTAVKADKILVMDAGRNPFEAVEAADIFCVAGAEFLLPSQMDLIRRVGAPLSVAGCTGLSFCAASVSSKISAGLADVSSRSLAKLVLA